MNQPSGTVTLVFTDIEGSTRLMSELGAEQYLAALTLHREQIRRAFGGFDGYEFGHAGDALFYAFRSATAAVAAVSEAMAALAGGSIRIRVGIHTGEPIIAPPDNYAGMDVHRAARIMAVAHGGQAVLSQATSEMLDDQVVLRDLGEHRLKDIAEPARLYQLGNARFPPLRSLYRANLPTPRSSFLGREREVAEVVSLCTGAAARMITLLGPGGIGKTRLALQAAADAAGDYVDGVYWVPLASLSDPALILPTVARALDLREESDRDTGTLLIEHLRGARLLLVLDNIEHLLPEGAAAIQAMADVDGPRLLLTSRSRLRLPGEHAYEVLPLESADAVELFSARARALTRHFSATPAVEVLCDRLDRLPLAIELAAARVPLLSPEQLLDRVGGRLDLLKGGDYVESRQRTLLATIDWSYELLDSEEQRVFRALSVFAGGCSLEAAEEICPTDLDALESLLDKSLLQRHDDGHRARYGMLETIRQRAEEHLESNGEADRIHAAHADWFIDLAVQADRAQRSLLLDSWLSRLAPEEHNLRAAMTWTSRRNDWARITRLAASLALTWVWRGEIAEIRRWVDDASEHLVDSDDASRARLLMVAGFVCAMQGDHVAADARLSSALALCKRMGDVEGVGFCLNSLGIACERRGDPAGARDLWEECRRLADLHGLDDRRAISALNLSTHALGENDLNAAHALADEAARTFAEAGSPLWCNALLLLSETARLGGDRDAAEDGLRRCLQACVDRHGRAIGTIALQRLAALREAREDGRGAALLLGATQNVIAVSGVATDVDPEVAEVLTNLERQLGQSELDELLAEGRTWSFDEAAHYALESA